MGVDVRFEGPAERMWRHIPNPTAFFARDNGWRLKGATFTVIGDVVMTMHWYQKNAMHARYVTLQNTF